MNQNVVAILRIKTMAEHAAGAGRADVPHVQEAEAAADAYGRLRAQARALTERAGWSVEEFDAEIPELEPLNVPPGEERGYHAVGRGVRARFLLGQLAAWAAGYEQAFEMEARLEAEARIKADQARRGPMGFGDRS